jgi:hypothetical protein
MKHSDIKALFISGFIRGIGWSFGVTLGFVLVSSLLALIVGKFNSLPIIGNIIADIIQETQKQLQSRTPGIK